jgi:hypothetical protein
MEMILLNLQQKNGKHGEFKWKNEIKDEND